MTRFSLLLLAALSLSGVVAAQSDRVEIYGGYSYVNPDFSLVSGKAVSGWNASVNFKFRPSIGIVADFSGFYPSYTYPPASGSTHASGTAYSFLFGPQVSMARGRFRPFARFLLGSTNVSSQSLGGQTFSQFQSNSGFSLAGGGGLDYSLTRHLAFRGQVDWLQVRLTPVGGGDPGANYVRNRNVARVSTGIVLRF